MHFLPENIDFATFFNVLAQVRYSPLDHMGRYANWLKQAVCKTVTLETLLVQIQPGPPYAHVTEREDVSCPNHDARAGV